MSKHNKLINLEVADFNELVENVYKKPYNLQQQNGCYDRRKLYLTIPSASNDNDMHDDIPDKVNGEYRGVKFATWLQRDPLQKSDNLNDDLSLEIFWHRNFYPDLNTLANDLYQNGLIESGKYGIRIDW